MLLNSLYVEYFDLNSKLHKLRELIAAYGGSLTAEIDADLPQIPTMPTESHSVVPEETKVISPVVEPYPKHGSWRDKMLHGLRQFGKPVTAKELAIYIIHSEESSEVDYITGTTAQYLSILYKEKRIASDKTNRPYTYSTLS